jgi:hypothetical protein
MTESRFSLEEVIVVRLRVNAKDRRPLLLTLVEIWLDRVVVRWTEPPPANPHTQAAQWLQVSISDDAGTEYARLGGSGSGDRGRWDAYASFSPSVPAKAQRLTVQLRDAEPVDLDIRDP